MQEFWDEVRKRTNGEIVCETFWGTLGGEQTLLNGVALGTLDGYHGAYTGMREFDLFYAANLFRDYEHAARVINGPLRPKLAQALEAKYKVHMLGLGAPARSGCRSRRSPPHGPTSETRRSAADPSRASSRASRRWARTRCRWLSTRSTLPSSRAWSTVR